MDFSLSHLYFGDKPLVLDLKFPIMSLGDVNRKDLVSYTNSYNLSPVFVSYICLVVGTIWSILNELWAVLFAAYPCMYWHLSFLRLKKAWKLDDFSGNFWSYEEHVFLYDFRADKRTFISDDLMIRIFSGRYMNMEICVYCLCVFRLDWGKLGQPDGNGFEVASMSVVSQPLKLVTVLVSSQITRPNYNN